MQFKHFFLGREVLNYFLLIDFVSLDNLIFLSLSSVT